jgi:hypothetical protein
MMDWLQGTGAEKNHCQWSSMIHIEVLLGVLYTGPVN